MSGATVVRAYAVNLVVDASVVVEWYVPERDHMEARQLRDDFLDGDADLHAPALLPFEVVDALRFSGSYEGDTLVEASESLVAYGIELTPFSGPIASVAQAASITVHDASYVALAEAVDGRAYTADEILLSEVEDTAYREVEGTAYRDRLVHIGGYGGR